MTETSKVAGRDTGLRRTSSLVFDAGAWKTKISERPAGDPVGEKEKKKISYKTESIVIPDSEEETDRVYHPLGRSFASPAKLNEKPPLEVIELSSDSEEDEEAIPNKSHVREGKPTFAEDPFEGADHPGPPFNNSILTTVKAAEAADEESSDSEPVGLPKTRTPGRPAWARRTIVSDSEESVDEPDKGNDEDSDDNAILVLNDPPAARRPLRKPNAFPTGTLSRMMSPDPTNDIRETPGGGRILTADRTPLQTPVRNRPLDGSERVPGYFDMRPAPPTKKSGKRKDANDNLPKDVVPSEGPSKAATPSSAQAKKGGKKISKKAMEAARQEQLQEYAQQLFLELNEKVFNNELPATTKLTWNKRLQTTAGKATWHSSKSEGVESTSIELACKVLDCEERIRNTLSHEMCHLASWVISRKPTENHGPVFSAWAKRVMQKRPDISISTKHTYEIAYKYEWKCQNPQCGYVYGRHSKSIDHTKTMCGVCRGDIRPLFETRSRKTKADGRLEAERKRDLPTPLEKYLSPMDPAAIKSSREGINQIDTEANSGEDSVVEVPTPLKSKVEGGNADRIVSGLIKHLSIIDLTED